MARGFLLSEIIQEFRPAVLELNWRVIDGETDEDMLVGLVACGVGATPEMHDLVFVRSEDLAGIPKFKMVEKSDYVSKR